MKGFSLLIDKKSKKEILQIDDREFVKNPEKFEDILDVLISEQRIKEKGIPWEKAKRQLKKAGTA